MTLDSQDETSDLGVDVEVGSPRWREHAGAETIVRRALSAAAAATRPLLPRASEVAVVLSDDAAVRALNREWRGHDQPTNVLSFPTYPPPRARHAAGLALLGDIVIAYETTLREAEEEKKAFDHHLTHLTVHGFLHLLGYDHESDGDAEAMEGLERAILARLGVPDPYGGGSDI
jgi:probable rRNA maturation factor